MSRDKQIDEMAKIMCEECAKDTSPCHYAKAGNMCDSVLKVAEFLYNAGYRKASDVAREIFEAFEGEMRSLIEVCNDLYNDSDDGYYVGKGDAFFTAIIHLDELIKKKYTEDTKCTN